MSQLRAEGSVGYHEVTNSTADRRKDLARMKTATAEAVLRRIPNRRVARAGAARDVQMLLAAVRWPVFSQTSFDMVRSLVQQGITARTVLDVGANRGQFSVAVLELMRPEVVHAFEPLPAAAARLRQLGSRYPALVVHETAVGAANGSAPIRVSEQTQSSSLLQMLPRHLDAFPESRVCATIDVRIQALDEMLFPADLRRPTLLKVDTQGFERAVILGGSTLLSAVDYVVLELSFTELYQGEMLFTEGIRLLDASGFAFARPVGTLRDPRTREYLQMDALFVRGSPEGDLTQER